MVSYKSINYVEFKQKIAFRKYIIIHVIGQKLVRSFSAYYVRNTEFFIVLNIEVDLERLAALS